MYCEGLGKNQLLERASDLLEIDLKIQSLLTTRTSGILSVEEATQLVQLKSRKEKLLTHQVLIWKLKSMVNWINEADANTKYFHTYSSSRRNSKSIWDLQNQGGELVEEDDQLKLLGVQHFSELFKKNVSPSIVDQLKVIRLFLSFV